MNELKLLSSKRSRLVDAYVEPPHDVCPRRGERGRETGGLGVVQHHDIARPHPVPQRFPLARHHRGVDLPLDLAERPTVTGLLVESVVQALRHLEEVAIASDDEPVHVDACAGHVGQQRVQQLGHPATRRRRVDMPQRAPAQDRACPGEHRIEPLTVGCAEDPLKGVGGAQTYRHDLHGRTGYPLWSPAETDPVLPRARRRQGGATFALSI
jgi:hypothetical protein